MSIRIIHSSDWHLGKTLFGYDRLPEQKIFLSWLLNYIQTQNIHYLLLSGDIFDRPIPSHEALKVYYQFLADLNKSSCSIFIIAGNHDSGKLLESPKPLFNQNKVKLIGELGSITSKEQLKRFVFNEDIKDSTSKEKLCITLLPYFKNHEFFALKELLNETEKDEYEKLSLSQKLTYLFSYLLKEIKKHQSKGINILMAHHLFGQFLPSGSEVEIALCGNSSFSLKLFEDYDYLALGHIHSPHCLQKNKPKAVYSGAPLSYRFNEEQNKAVSLLEIGEGVFTHQFVEIPLIRKLVSINYAASLPLEEELALAPLLEIAFNTEDYTSANLANIETQCRNLGYQLINTSINKKIDVTGEASHHEKGNFEGLNECNLKDIFDLFLESKNLSPDKYQDIIASFLSPQGDNSFNIGNSVADLSS